MMPLNRDAILNAIDRKIEPVEVPEWGGVVWVKTISSRQFIELQNLNKNGSDFALPLTALAMCDEQGNSLFTLADVDALAEKSQAALNRVIAKVAKLNSFDVEEAEKN